MLNKKFFALSILASLLAFGCSDDAKKKDSAPAVTAECNNGVLEGSEVCDGDNFADGARVCPTGHTIDDVNKITCNSDCTLNTSACEAIDTSKCGNDALDGNEECDKAAFVAEKRVCPNGYEVDEIEKLVCTESCTIDKGACTPKCSNGKIDDDEVCDGDKFADGKRVCPEGYTVDDVSKITCKSDCTLDTSACEKDENNTCDNGELDGDEVCDGDKFADGKRVCPNGYTVDDVSKITCTADCTLNTSACVPESGDGVRCENNVLQYCMDGECDEENCSAFHAICDVDAVACIPVDFTCDGTVIKLTGTEFSYDCANNKALEGNLKDDVLCNTYHGCADVACVGDDIKICDESTCEIYDTCEPGLCSDREPECLVCQPDAFECAVDDETGLAVARMCIDGEGWLEDICAKGWACDVTKNGCYNADPCSDPGEGICTGSDDKTYKYCNPTTNAWETTVCISDCDADSGCGTCGDTFKQDFEVCDESVTDIQYKPTCEERFGRDHKWTGTPACNDTCSGYVTGTCKIKEDKEITSWTIDNLEKLKKEGKIDLKGGMKTTEAVDGGWRVGPWGNAKSPAFDTRYIAFISSETDSSKYDSLAFTFDVMRNSKGPKALKVAFYDGDTKFFESKEITVTTSVVSQRVGKLDPKTSGKISVRVSAYKSDEVSTGTMTISNMRLLGTLK